MGPATQAKSPASGRGDEESVGGRVSDVCHSFGDPQSSFSSLAYRDFSQKETWLSLSEN